MDSIKTLLLSALSVFCSFIAYVLGGWDWALQTLIIFISVDFISGLLIAAVWNKSTKTVSGKIDSRACWQGLIRKGGILLVVLISNRLDTVMGTDGFVRTAVIFYFIGNEGISIIENLGIMGIPLPNWIKENFQNLKDKMEQQKNIKTK